MRMTGAPDPGPEHAEPTTRRGKGPFVNLGFKVPREFRQHFKRLAVDADISSVELLRQSVEAYERQNGIAP